ncbi:MAG: putative Ig domain-containing protein [Fimbriimonadaceae bacterium]|nr:putative Ig domain-containing protein [Fimbriimonadaceae bacterium]
MRLLFTRMLAVLLTMAVGAVALAATFYVSPVGDDLRDGRSWGSAKRTIAAAMSVAARGDNVFVRFGTYHESFTLPAAVRLYGSFRGDESTVGQRNREAYPTFLDGTGFSTVVTLAGGSTFETVFDGFTIVQGERGLTSSATNVTVRACTFQRCGTGLGHSAGSTSIRVYSCRFLGCGIGATVSGNGSVRVESCLFADGGVGLSVDWDGTVPAINCTFVGHLRAPFDGDFSSVQLDNCIVAYNVFCEGDYQGFGKLGIAARNTCYFGNISGTPPVGVSTVDPLFADPMQRNWHLQPSSPLRDIGDVTYVTAGVTDSDGQVRVTNGGVDLGSDESYGEVWPKRQTRRYYVSTSGSDTRSGASWADARRSIATTAALTQPGDEIWVKGGNYAESIAVPSGVSLHGGFAGTESGLSQRHPYLTPTILDGSGRAAVVSLQGGTVFAMTLSGFRISQGATFGVAGSCADITMENVWVTGASTGAFFIDYPRGRNRIASCRFELCGWGLQLGSGLANNAAPALIESCLFRGNSLALRHEANGSSHIVHCTFVENTSAVFYGWFSTATMDASVIAYNASILVTGSGTGLAYRNCCFYDNLLGSPPVGDGNFVADPLFVDPFAGDYHLGIGSPCIDIGDPAAVTTAYDMDGDPRVLPYGTGRPDLGADEYPNYTGNQPPVLDAIPDKQGVQGLTLTFTATGRDPEGQPLSFSLRDAPAGATIHGTTGVFTWTPAFEGVYEFRVRVTDSGSPPLTDEKTVRIIVVKPSIESFSIAPNPATGGANVQGAFRLTAAAPDGGFLIALGSTFPALAGVPNTVTVPAGQREATFPVIVAGVTAATEVEIVAQTPVQTERRTLQIVPSALQSFSISPHPQEGGLSTTGFIQLTGPAGAGGATFTVTSASPALVQVPSSVTVNAQDSSVPFTITTTQVTINTTVRVTVARGTETLGFDLTLLPPAIRLSLPSNVGPGSISTGTVTVNARNNSQTVNLSSGNAAIASVSPTSVTIPAGQTSASFTITAGNPASATSVTITATSGSSQTSGTVTVAPGKIVRGSFSTNGRASLAGEPITVVVRNVGSGTNLRSYDVVVKADGTYEFSTDLAAGSYDLYAKHRSTLRKKLANATLGASGLNGASFALVNGDVNGDNSINVADFLAFRAAFGASPASNNWNPNADLNGDRSVSVSDFLILRAGFGKSGD